MYRDKPVEIHLVNLWVKGLNFFLFLVEENGEIAQRSFHWEHLGEAVDLCTNLIQHAFYPYKQKKTDSNVNQCFHLEGHPPHR